MITIMHKVYTVSCAKLSGVGRSFVEFDDREEAFRIFRELQTHGYKEVRIEAEMVPRVTG